MSEGFPILVNKEEEELSCSSSSFSSSSSSGGSEISSESDLDREEAEKEEEQKNDGGGEEEEEEDEGEKKVQPIETIATSDGFAVDRSAGHNSMQPKEILTNGEWRPYSLCRKIINISDSITAVIEKTLNSKHLKRGEIDSAISQLRLISESAKRLADQTHAEFVQIWVSSSASMVNPETFGHGSIVQLPSSQKTGSNAAAAATSATSKSPARASQDEINSSQNSPNLHQPYIGQNAITDLNELLRTEIKSEK